MNVDRLKELLNLLAMGRRDVVEELAELLASIEPKAKAKK